MRAACIPLCGYLAANAHHLRHLNIKDGLEYQLFLYVIRTSHMDKYTLYTTVYSIRYRQYINMYSVEF